MPEAAMSRSAADIADLADEYWAFELRERPLSAILAGLDPPGADLFRESPADHDRQASSARSLKARLAQVEIRDLAPQDRATADMLDHELSSAERLYEADAHLRPSFFPAGPDFNTIYLANATMLHDAAAAERYLDQLAQMPANVEGLCQSLKAGRARGYRYPGFVLDRAAAATRANIAGPPQDHVWLSPFRRSGVAGRWTAEAERAERLVRDAVQPAFAAYADLLAGPLRESATDAPGLYADKDGDALYVALCDRYTTTRLSPAEIHEIGLSEVERLSAALGALAREAGCADPPALRAFVTDQPSMILQDGPTLRAALQALAKTIDAKIPTLFGRVPRATYGVESMTVEQSARMPPAYAQPGSARAGRAGLFWVSALPEKCPRHMHVPVILHEAWPGHLMHIALLEEQNYLPAFRRYGAVKYTACIEGWALYCETLGYDMGLFDSVEARFGQLDMEMWRAVRLVVDTGLHALGWSRQKAIEVMETHLSLDRSTIEAEVDRYAALPGQALAYQIGGRAVKGLRRRMEAALGERFQLRAFHDAVTSAGATPLPILERLVEGALVGSLPHAA